MRYATHFILWRDEEYWVISDARDDERPWQERAGRLLQTRDAKFAKNMHRIMQTEAGWWD